MKIEMPEDFVEKLPWMSINGKPDLIQWGNHVRFRDAAIRAECNEIAINFIARYGVQYLMTHPNEFSAAIMGEEIGHA